MFERQIEDVTRQPGRHQIVSFHFSSEARMKGPHFLIVGLEETRSVHPRKTNRPL